MNTLYVIARKTRAHERNERKNYNKKTAEKVKKGAGYALITALLVMFSAALIAQPERYVAVCLEGIMLWAQCVLPALFPFMVVCGILVNTGIAEKLSAPFGRICGALKLPQAAAMGFMMSISSGYPTGSRTVSQFYDMGICAREGCAKLAYLCSTSGPLFVIGTVGAGFFGDAGIGAKIFAAHILAVAAVSVMISLAGKRQNGVRPVPVKRENVLYESFYGSVSAALTAGAFIAFFYTAAAMAHDHFILLPIEKLLVIFMGDEAAEATAAGLIELTGGCAKLGAYGGELAVPLAGMLITFGGACILLQQISYLHVCGVRTARFLAAKAAQSAVCFLLLLIPI